MKLNRREALISLAAMAAGCASTRMTTMSKKPNLLFILTDQWRASALGCTGNPTVKTPHIDHLASQGALYENAFANTPLCSPSRASLLTGKFAVSLDMVTNDIPIHSDETSIAHVLGREGFRNGYIGKWHIESQPRDGFIPPGPRRLGFDDYWAVLNCHHDYFDGRYYLNDSDEMIHIEGYEPDHQTKLAQDFIRDHLAHHPDNPFCLFLSYGPPHAPYQYVPEHYVAMYPEDDIVFRPNCVDPDLEVLAQYYGACTALDDNIGRLLTTVDELGLTDDTIVVFTSDHGDMLWSHGNIKKQQPWDESSRIPFIVRYPQAVAQGQRVDTLLSVADMMPTLLSMMDVPIPETVQGLDLAWSMTGGTGEEPSSVFLGEMVGLGQCNHNGIYAWRGVRSKDYLYAEDLRGAWLLYDMNTDPYQQHNRVNDHKYAIVRDELAQELQDWLTKLNDPFLPGMEMLKKSGHYDEFMGIMERFFKFAPETDPAYVQLKAYMADSNLPSKRYE